MSQSNGATPFLSKEERRRYVSGELDPLPWMCGAVKDDGEICIRFKIKDDEWCASHTEKDLVPPDDPFGTNGSTIRKPKPVLNYNGRFVPTRLRRRYDELQRDPDRLSMMHEITIIDARLAEVLESIDTNEAGAVWKNLGEKWRAMLQARRRGDQEIAAGLLNDIGGLIKSGLGEHAKWGEVYDAIQLRRRVVETEHKLLISRGYMISVEEMMSILIRMTELIERHVEDEETKRKLAVEASKFMTIEGKIVR